MLLTKLHIPASGNNIVHRSKLFEQLNSGLSRKLILVSAPAGFGKTTIISDWIIHNKIPTVWFSLDNGDNDPSVFLRYIITGIHSIHKEFGQSALRLLNSPNSPSVESIASLLINEIININKNFLLVLDDFHLIMSIEVLRLVSYLLEHIPVNIHIVILTRSDPSLNVSRLRSQHQLVELRSSDLSFSANDISVLFNKKLKLGLSIDDIYSLETKTEGWIAGLQLTALSMQGHEDISGFIQEFKGDNRYIMDYLMEEVLKIQTDDIKEFLLQTSILEQMSAPLCNTVLNRNDSQVILEILERNNMFVIPLDDERNWYRYHHLFADLLKQKLLQKETSIIEAIHNKACNWFEENSMSKLAIEHALEINNYEKGIQILGGIVEHMWETGRHSAILKYGNLLPDELIKKNPEFCLYYAWILIIAGQIQNAEPFLVSAEITTRLVINGNSSPEELVHYYKKLLGKISVAYAYMYSLIANSGKIYDYSKTAMENLSEDDPFWYSWGWYSIGMAELLNDHFKESIDAYKKALEYGKKSGSIFLISTIGCKLAAIESRMGLYTSSYKNCSDLITFMKESGYSQIAKSECTFAGLYTCMAGIELMRTDLDDAFKNIKTAYSLSKNDSNSSYKVSVLLIYALTLYGRRDTAGFNKMINEAEDIIKLNKIVFSIIDIYVAVKGLFLVQQNELERAHHFFKEMGLGLEKKISYTDEHGYVGYAFLLVIELKFEEAEILLSKLLVMAEAANRTERIIEIKIIYAILYKATGNKENALTNLIEALEHAACENILMSFVLYHSEISDLLKEVYKIQETTRTRIPKKSIDKLKLAIEKRGKFKIISSESGLSDRELDALILLAEDLSNQEIADKLFISLNTVKTHLKNIFFKLETNNRSGAVTKAKKRGLL